MATAVIVIVLDSIELMQVVGFLESTSGIPVDDTELEVPAGAERYLR